MEVSKVTNDDGRNCAQLLALLKVGRWEMTGKDAEALVQVKSWVTGLAQQMALQLKTPAPTASAVSAGPGAPAPAAQAAPPPSESPGFKIKAMGPIGGTAARMKPSKRK